MVLLSPFVTRAFVLCRNEQILQGVKCFGKHQICIEACEGIRGGKPA